MLLSSHACPPTNASVQAPEVCATLKVRARPSTCQLRSTRTGTARNDRIMTTGLYRNRSGSYGWERLRQKQRATLPRQSGRDPAHAAWGDAEAGRLIPLSTLHPGVRRQAGCLKKKGGNIKYNIGIGLNFFITESGFETCFGSSTQGVQTNTHLESRCCATLIFYSWQMTGNAGRSTAARLQQEQGCGSGPRAVLQCVIKGVGGRLLAHRVVP